MNDINDFKTVKEIQYKGETYSVRDNGAVCLHARPGKRVRKEDNCWTFGKRGLGGYLYVKGERVHRIVALAFLGEPTEGSDIVDHIDTNRQNNRPENLRWCDKGENILKNPLTIRKIEYRAGVSVQTFLADPKKYRDCLKGQNTDWMRPVSEKEALIVKKRNEDFLQSPSGLKEPKGPMGEWMYHEPSGLPFNSSKSKFSTDTDNLIDSLTSGAKQRNWKTPECFLLCPEEKSLELYASKLKKGELFAKDNYGNEQIVRASKLIGERELIVVATENIKEAVKPYGLAIITLEEGFFVHESQGTFFSDGGVDKYFTLACGEPYEGEDSIDDYC